MSRDLERALDAYLAAAAAAGDRTARADLAARWTPKLSALAVRLTGDRELARDAVQDAWIEILRGLPRLADPQAFPAWAFRILARRAARAVDARVKARGLAEKVAREPGPEPRRSAEEAADLAAIRRAVADLPAAQAAAIQLHIVEGLSVAETAAALDVPAGTVKTRLMHARRKLAARFDEGGSR